MPWLFWDASALAKRYAPEIGTGTVDALFVEVPPSQMVLTFPGYAECYSTLLRKRNRGTISAATSAAAKSSLRLEVIDNPDFVVLEVDSAAVLAGMDLMERHNINSSDAAILATYQDYVSSLLTGGQPCVLIASDQRLLRAAAAEGLATLNPETVAAADIPSLLASL